MITAYSELLTRLSGMIAFDSQNPGSVDVGEIVYLIQQAEQRIYREVRTGYNTASFGASDTVSSNSLTLPDEFRNMGMIHFGGYPLEPVAPEVVQQKVTDGLTGDCLYFATIGRTLQFAPSVANGTQAQGHYYCALDPLDDTTLPTNSLFAAANDLFLYAVMVEAGPAFSLMDFVPIYEQKYQAVRDRLNSEHTWAAYSAGRARRRPSTSLLG